MEDITIFLEVPKLENINYGISVSYTHLDVYKRQVVESAGRHQRLFSSNNYLDLANDPEVKEAACEALEQYGVGAGGSRLTTGTGPLHVRLEEMCIRDRLWTAPRI